METNFIKILCKPKIQTFFLSTLIALNGKCVPRFMNLVTLIYRYSRLGLDDCENITFQWGPPVFPKILYDRGRKNLLTAKAGSGTEEALSAKLLTREAIV